MSDDPKSVGTFHDHFQIPPLSDAVKEALSQWSEALLRCEEAMAHHRMTRTRATIVLMAARMGVMPAPADPLTVEQEAAFQALRTAEKQLHDAQRDAIGPWQRVPAR